MRWTWRRFGWLGSRATRERCFTVTPEWMSPSTPRPARRVMDSRLGLLKLYSPLLLTATTRGCPMAPLWHGRARPVSPVFPGCDGGLDARRYPRRWLGWCGAGGVARPAASGPVAGGASAAYRDPRRPRAG